jgi:hypothetical protein
MIDRHCSRASGPCYSTTLPGNYGSGKFEGRDDDESSERRREDQVLSRERRLCSNVEYITKTTRHKNYEVKINKVPRTLPGPLGARTFGPKCQGNLKARNFSDPAAINGENNRIRS